VIFLISVLVVDDAAFMRLAIKNVLEKSGFKVIADAKNGQEGIEKYIECRPDIVTMDITMPDMTGIDALKKIREYDPNRKSRYDFCYGTGENGKRSHNQRRQVFYSKTIQGRAITQTLLKIAADK
jgi:two-component system chemotaxis response regulator CheY